MLSSFIFHPDSDSLCSTKDRLPEGIGGGNAVCNRDTGFGLIETSQDIYCKMQREKLQQPEDQGK